MRAAVGSFDRDAFVDELLDISAADEGADDCRDGDSDDLDDDSHSTIEEELEWISNKDAFPALETFLDISQDELFQHGSPISVLENSSLTSTTDNSGDGYDGNVNWGRLGVPVRARTKCARKRRLDGFGEIPTFWEKDLCRHPIKVPRSDPGNDAKIGRNCLHCGAQKTPQWRAGPCGPKTLCNACGVRYKSGRLVPEYRPASSPTFSSELHSNSHRKIMEMRRVNGQERRMARKNSCD